MTAAAAMGDHTGCECQRLPIIGARYRRMSVDLITNTKRGWKYYIVVKIEEQCGIFCLRAVLLKDDGKMWRPQIPALAHEAQALNNIVPLHPSLDA